MINKERLIKTFLELVRISSPSGEEKEVSEYIIKELECCGFKLSSDNAGSESGGNCDNLLASWMGPNCSGETLVFCCHMDCVVPCDNVTPVIKEDIITTDGSTVLGADDKAGIAMLMEIAKVIKENDITAPRIHFLFTVSEEVGLLGAKQIDKDFMPEGHAFVLDGESSVGAITVESPYSEKITVNIKGKAAHAGIEPEKGISAIQIAAKAITELPLGRINKSTTMNVGKIDGGCARNIVPERATLDVEIRSFDSKEVLRLVEVIKDAFRHATEEYGGYADVLHENEFSGFKLKENDTVVRLAVEGADMSGIDTNIIISGGGSDANVFNKNGNPSVVLAIGFENAHTKNELIKISNLVKGAEWILGIIKASVNGNL